MLTQVELSYGCGLVSASIILRWLEGSVVLPELALLLRIISAVLLLENEFSAIQLLPPIDVTVQVSNLRLMEDRNASVALLQTLNADLFALQQQLLGCKNKQQRNGLKRAIAELDATIGQMRHQATQQTVTTQRSAANVDAMEICEIFDAPSSTPGEAEACLDQTPPLPMPGEAPITVEQWVAVRARYLPGCYLPGCCVNMMARGERVYMYAS